MALTRTLFLTAALVAAAGCGGARPPQPADPGQARDTLRLVLDSWTRGAAPHSLRERPTPVYVKDRAWQTGRRLVRYELLSDTPVGADLRCRVRLTTRSAGGSPVRRLAVYSVATSPALTVTREEEP